MDKKSRKGEALQFWFSGILAVVGIKVPLAHTLIGLYLGFTGS